MLVILGSTLSLVLVGALIYSEIRSAVCGITLSNGVEVLVSSEMYREILYQYRTLDLDDDRERWDQAILDVLRPVRPREWKYRARTLGYHVSGERYGARRRRLTVHR
jgi:hypothetical protein